MPDKKSIKHLILLQVDARWWLCCGHYGRMSTVGKNVQSVQTHLTHSKLEITQTLLIQGVTSRTIPRKPQFLDSKSAGE